MTFELIILGSSSALPTSKRFPTAHLLKVDERFFLIDCGEGTQIQLRKFGLNPARIHHIFISHLHGDHVFGLFGLLSTMGMMGRKVPLHLYGPARLKEMMTQHLSFFGQLPFELLVEMLGHGAHLALRAPAGDHHEIGNAGFVREIDDDRVFGFVVLERGLHHLDQVLTFVGARFLVTGPRGQSAGVSSRFLSALGDRLWGGLIPACYGCILLLRFS